MKISLTEYNSNWPAMFEREREVLQRALDGVQTAIEHIGSTAVPGLVSKPIIDIMIGLEDFVAADGLVPRITGLGYTYIPKYEDVMPYRRFFKKLVDPVATHHLHMVEINSEFWKRHLLFRDTLRNNPETADKYGILKTELAKHDWNDSNDYANAKTQFIRSVERKAMNLRKNGIKDI